MGFQRWAAVLKAALAFVVTVAFGITAGWVFNAAEAIEDKLKLHKRHESRMPDDRG